MCPELRVFISETDADAERLAVLGRYLRAELLQLDIAGVAALRAGGPPPGTRALDVSVVGGLLVNLGHSAEALGLVVSLIRDWLGRGNASGRTVRLELDGDVLELSGASTADQRRMIGLFVGRHGARESESWTATERL